MGIKRFTINLLGCSADVQLFYSCSIVKLVCGHQMAELELSHYAAVKQLLFSCHTADIQLSFICHEAVMQLPNSYFAIF